MKTATRCTSRAFTLIELLVLCAIILLALALLLPTSATGKVRDQNRRAQCLLNLHQIGAGLAAYSADFSGRLPMRGGYAYNLKEPKNYHFSPVCSGATRDPVNIGVLYGTYGGTDLSRFYCPSDRRSYESTTNGAITFPADVPGDPNYPTAGVTWSGYIYAVPVPPGCFPKDDHAGDLTYDRLPCSTNPSLPWLNYTDWMRAQVYFEERPYQSQVMALVADSLVYGTTAVHEGGYNVLFTDYHARRAPDRDYEIAKLAPMTSGIGGQPKAFQAWNILSRPK